jgi:hypothetical protein
VLVDPFGFDIVVLDPEQEGKVVGRYGEFGNEDGFFAYPTGIAYDPARDWFAITDTANDRVQVVRIPGSTSQPIPAAARRFLSGPFGICSIPLILLLIALFLGVLRSRTRRREDRVVPPGETGLSEWDVG